MKFNAKAFVLAAFLAAVSTSAFAAESPVDCSGISSASSTKPSDSVSSNKDDSSTKAGSALGQPAAPPVR